MAINGLAVEIFASDLGVSLISHGDEGVAFTGVENVVNAATLAELGLQEVPGARGAYAVHEKFDSVVAHGLSESGKSEKIISLNETSGHLGILKRLKFGFRAGETFRK